MQRKHGNVPLEESVHQRHRHRVVSGDERNWPRRACAKLEFGRYYFGFLIEFGKTKRKTIANEGRPMRAPRDHRGQGQHGAHSDKGSPACATNLKCPAPKPDTRRSGESNSPGCGASPCARVGVPTANARLEAIACPIGPSKRWVITTSSPRSSAQWARARAEDRPTSAGFITTAQM